MCYFRLSLCQHLEKQDGNREQDDHDVLLVLTFILLPVEGFVEEDDEQQQDANTTEPAAINCAPDEGTDDTYNRQNHPCHLYFTKILFHLRLNKKSGPIKYSGKAQITM